MRLTAHEKRINGIFRLGKRTHQPIIDLPHFTLFCQLERKSGQGEDRQEKVKNEASSSGSSSPYTWNEGKAIICRKISYLNALVK